MASQRICGDTLNRRLDRAAELSNLARQASSKARRVNDIHSHQRAIEAHRRANVHGRRRIALPSTMDSTTVTVT
jgi:hypothetical protein